jgi:Mn2+/Fe2+ NRAMP family transporter
MGDRVNSRSMSILGWACALVMSTAAIGLLVSLR